LQNKKAAKTAFLNLNFQPHRTVVRAHNIAVYGRRVNPVGNSYRPEGMTEQECKVAQKAAHKAVKKPYQVTKIK
jgi:hypothetical protein